MVARMSSPGTRRLLLACAIAICAACGGGTSGTEARKPVTPLDKTTTGTIRGQVVWSVDAAPARTTVNFSADPACAAAHPEPVLSQDAVVNAGFVENVVVYLKSGLGDRGFDVPKEPVTIDQKGCLYQPRVVGVQAGQPIAFTNNDPVLHNVHGTPADSSAWNFGSMKGSTRTITLEHPEVAVSVRCDIHPWMQAWLAVFDHPYFAVTGPRGTFVINDVPPGTYTVAAWHEKFGEHEKQVTLAPKETEFAEFHYPEEPTRN